MTVRKYIHDYFFAERSYTAIRYLRFLVFFGGALFFLLFKSLQPPTFFDVWRPISFYQLLSGPVDPSIVQTLYYVWLAIAALAGLGVWFWWTSKIAFVLAVLHLGYEYNFNHVYHSTHVYIMTMGILAFARTTHPLLFSKEKPIPDMSGENQWPIAWIKLYVVYAFFVCGLQKLYYGNGLEWALSDNFYIRLLVNPHHPWLNEWSLNQPLIVSILLALFALTIEVLAPLALLGKRLGLLFVISWILMHICVTGAFGGHIQFFSQCFAYMAFLDWDRIHLRRFFCI